MAGRLLTVQDHASNQTTLTYDLLGRKTSMNDPDMGAWQYRYDAAGNLVLVAANVGTAGSKYPHESSGFVRMTPGTPTRSG